MKNYFIVVLKKQTIVKLIFSNQITHIIFILFTGNLFDCLLQVKVTGSSNSGFNMKENDLLSFADYI